MDNEEGATRTGLTVRLLEARRAAGSPFGPYFDALPASFDDHPASFGPEARAMLEGSSALEDVDRLSESLDADYERVAAMPALAGCTRAEFAWATCVTMSRTFRIKVEQLSCRMLVPLADMANHHPDAQCKWEVHPGEGVFVVRAVRPIEPGEEIFYSYGKKCACRFFGPYGFVPDHGATDCVTLRLRVEREEDGVKHLGSSEVHALADAASTQRMLSFFRAALVGPQPGTPFSPAPVDEVEPVSLDVEARALDALVAHCEGALGRLAAGSAARARPEPGAAARARLCSRVCDAEARALAFHRDVAREALAALATPGGLQRAAEDARYAPHAPYFHALLRLHGA